MRRVGVLMNLAADNPHRMPAARRSSGALLSYWAGPTAVTCKSSIAGPLVMLTMLADMRQNWWHSRPKSSWRMGTPSVAGAATNDPHRARGLCEMSLTRSGPDLSIAWRGRAATSPGFPAVRIRHEREVAGIAQ